MWDWFTGAMGGGAAGSSQEFANFGNANFDSIGVEGTSPNFSGMQYSGGSGMDAGIMEGLLNQQQQPYSNQATPGMAQLTAQSSGQLPYQNFMPTKRHPYLDGLMKKGMGAY